MNPLERGYRRLLLAYPRDYRRDRGDEILTTLMDAAPPDRARPPVGEAWELVRGGLRQRFAPPRGRGYTVVALACAAAVAYLSVGAATRLATDPEARNQTLLAAVALLPPEGMAMGDADRMWTTFGGPTEVDLTFATEPHALDDLAADVRARAVADGWTAGPIGPEHRFTMDRAGETFVVTVADGVVAQPGAEMSFHTRHPWPAALLPGGIAAVVLGGLAGWLAGAWTLRRFRSRVPAGQLLVALTGAAGLVLVAAAAVSALATTRDATGATLFTGDFADMLGLAGLATAPLLAAVLPATGPAAERRPKTDLVRAGIRTVTAAHLAFGAAMATVLVTFAVRMLVTGADRAEMVSGAHDPKELLPLPVHVPVALLYYSGVVLSPLLLLVSIPLLGIGRGRVGRVAWWVLVAAAVSAVVLPALLLTPYGGDAARWWLD